MNYGLFVKLYENAKTCKDIDNFIVNYEKDPEVNKQHDNIALFLRFIYDIAHMGIRDIREYLGMTRPKFCEYYEIKLRTLEDWEYEKNPVPERLLKLLSYTLIQDFIN